MTQEEFAVWVASRKAAGTSIEAENAELKGWWVPVGDPYAQWAPARSHQSIEVQLKVHFFVSGPDSSGWVWQDDLPDDKRMVVQARVDEHNRWVKEFYVNCQAAGCLIDTDTCEGLCVYADELDPYDVELADYGCVNRQNFVRNKDDEDWVHVSDLPEEKKLALKERAERERLR
jgi:hypothetical protein